MGPASTALTIVDVYCQCMPHAIHTSCWLSIHNILSDILLALPFRLPSTTIAPIGIPELDQGFSTLFMNAVNVLRLFNKDSMAKPCSLRNHTLEH